MTLIQKTHPATYSPTMISDFISFFTKEGDNVLDPDTSLRHLQFVYQSLLTLNKTLSQFNREVDIFYAEAADVFKYLHKTFDIKNIFSFRESGTQITWKRDKTIKSFCKSNQINWEESQRDGIIRGIKNRTDWNKQWHISMHQPVIYNKYSYANEKA